MGYSLSKSGFEFLKKREGVIYRPVWDRTNYAVGIGHNGPDVNPNKVYTDAEINAFFKSDSVWCTSAANKFSNIQNQCQFDALFSLCYNCGGGIAAGGMAIFDMMRRNEHVTNPNEFTAKWKRYRWNGGQLRSRRNYEISLFYSQSPTKPSNLNVDEPNPTSYDSSPMNYGASGNQGIPNDANVQSPDNIDADLEKKGV